MKPYVSLWDRFFGKRVKLELVNGSFRLVTKKWLESMENAGQIKKIEGDLINVHILDPQAELLWVLNPTLPRPGTYRQDVWRIGVDISYETFSEFKDPASGELYVLMSPREGYATPQPLAIKKDLWDDAKRQMDELG